MQPNDLRVERVHMFEELKRLHHIQQRRYTVETNYQTSRCFQKNPQKNLFV